MRKYFIATALLLCGCAAQQKVESPPTPAAAAAEVNDQQGACIGGASYELCSFAVNVVEKNLIPIAFVSKKSLGDGPDGNPTWEILDEIALPSNMAGRFIQYASCRYSGESDDTVVALVPPHDSEAPEYIKAADWAFKVALPSGKFQELDSAKVDCINTAIGAE
ncbi:MAG TPA: hypothetical protein VLC91_06405 [Spongiibacteraceae bacterium]|nr:hypothetical protein [Spongiibacteraceae bacterium]